MNGLIQRHRTLGELLAELKARLGFVAQGPASNNNNPVMISFLQEAHDYVYDQLNPHTDAQENGYYTGTGIVPLRLA